MVKAMIVVAFVTIWLRAKAKFWLRVEARFWLQAVAIIWFHVMAMMTAGRRVWFITIWFIMGIGECVWVSWS